MKVNMILFNMLNKMSSRNAQVSQKYRKKSHLEHIKERPDTYIGSCDARIESMWVLNTQDQFEFREISYVPGILKIFDEIFWVEHLYH